MPDRLRTLLALATLPCLLALSTTAAAQGAASPRPAIAGVSHIAVYAADPAATERFYVHDLGARLGEGRRQVDHLVRGDAARNQQGDAQAVQLARYRRWIQWHEVKFGASPICPQARAGAPGG